MLPGDGVATSPGVEGHEDEVRCDPTGPHGDDHDRMREDVREVHLVDASEEVDDRGARGRLLGHALAHKREREEQTEARSRVRLQEEVDRLAALATSPTPSGARTPWLIALFRKRTFPTSIGMSAKRQQAGGDDRIDEAAKCV